MAKAVQATPRSEKVIAGTWMLDLALGQKLLEHCTNKSPSDSIG
jgi:hypothetical protein